MAIPEKFDAIRPYEVEEIPLVLGELLADPQFVEVLRGLGFGSGNTEQVQQLAKCRTALDFQKAFVAPLIKKFILEKHCKGIHLDASQLQSQTGNYTYISNHRDIVLDSALFDVLLVDNGFTDTVEIAIGDNLLAYPWIEKFVRLNKAFIVRRSLGIREMLAGSKLLSEYMHHAINEKQQSLWIAQREGRAKDSNDRTQESLLKMLAMGGEGTLIERLKALHIVPLSISYEYDPCDFLKAKEFQLKRDNPEYKKTPADDLENMQTGIFGDKGRIAFVMGHCIDEELDQLAEKDKAMQLKCVAQLIDTQIFSNYTLYPCNYVARDLLLGTEKGGYSIAEKTEFETYLASRLSLINIPNKDEAFLRERILTMYANPLINHEAATSSQKS